MAKQENSQHGCFSSFFKVLLCARNETSPPVYPSENVEEKKDDFFDDSNSITTPSVVARLMGLDSLPKTKRVVQGTTLDCVPRSKSVNFVDYLLEFDQSIGNHRRVKTSSSFREVPSQKNYLFVLDIDDKKGNKVQEENVTKLKKKNKEIVRVKKEKNKRIYKLKDEPRRVPSSKYKSKVRDCRKGEVFSSVSPRCNCGYYGYGDVGSSSSSSSVSPLPKNRIKKGFVEPKMRNKVKKNHVSTKKIQTEHSLENLSPVSVLDVNDYAFLYGADYSGTNTLASKSKRKSKSLLEVSLDEDVEEKANSNKGYASHTDINREAELYSDLMLKIRSLTEESIKESDCTYKDESFQEICLVFEETILHSLLFEVLNELV
ncbi:uncharacterized protein LOC127106809 [Lathyrus oleraceus]|uniref:DUF3741 domain-containing protein n=1 Tax=Pisum sativum TaxID=3888 RepID=A0A9D4VXA1_PEA|nr:uncharacterized protein LOC127106809 [Pisum sativum]KAI5392023.1 hypothetical protein KIW84_076712 [Pisum sativum]